MNKKNMLTIVNNIELGGGVQSVILNLRNIIENSEIPIEVDYLVLSKQMNNDIKLNLKKNEKIYRINNFNIRNLKSIFELFKILISIRNKYSKVHLNVSSGSEVLILIMLKFIGYEKIITHVHNCIELKGIKKNILNFSFKFFSDVKIGCSIEANNSYFGENNGEVFNNFFDTSIFLYSNEFRKVYRKENGIKKDDIVIGIVGRLELVKNHEFALNLIKELVKISKSYKLLIIGDGKLKNNILEYIHINNLSNNIILKEATLEINKIYSALDILILPSKSEGLGLVLVEAQYSGVKCIASNCVPKATKITKLVDYIDTNNKNMWIDNILKFKNIDRYNLEILSDKFNINSEENIRKVKKILGE